MSTRRDISNVIAAQSIHAWHAAYSAWRNCPTENRGARCRLWTDYKVARAQARDAAEALTLPFVETANGTWRPLAEGWEYRPKAAVVTAAALVAAG